MILERLSLANCGGFEQIEIDFEPDLTLIVGVNGVGKSTLLRVIAVLLSKTHRRLGLNGEQPRSLKKEDIFTGADSVNARLTFDICERKLFADLNAIQHRKRFEKFDLFGLTDEVRHTNMLAVLYTPRRQLPGQPRTLPEAKPFAQEIAYSRALEDRDVSLRDFMHWFHTQQKLGGRGEPRRANVLDALKAVVSELLPGFTDLRIQETPRLGFVVDKYNQPFFLHQLSDGERGLLALVLDLTRRLAIANPQCENPINDGVALVLIDEIELHLHPKWQRDAIKRLPVIFRKSQFVITTHSPQVIGEVQARCVRILCYKEGRVITETPGMAFGVDSNWILNVLMGADEMNVDVDRELEVIAQLVSTRNLNEAKEKIDVLRNRVGNTEAIQKLVSIIERIERLGK